MAIGANHLTFLDLFEKASNANVSRVRGDIELLVVKMVKVHDVVRKFLFAVSARDILEIAYDFCRLCLVAPVSCVGFFSELPVRLCVSPFFCPGSMTHLAGAVPAIPGLVEVEVRVGLVDVA